MADREKTIKDLEEALAAIRVGHFEKIPFWGTISIIMMDARDLLKDQDATWLDRTDIDDVYILLECSRCRHKSPDEHRYRYCPHCGARMNVERGERA